MPPKKKAEKPEVVPEETTPTPDPAETGKVEQAGDVKPEEKLKTDALEHLRNLAPEPLKAKNGDERCDYEFPYSGQCIRGAGHKGSHFSQKGVEG